ncbi:MAG: hypothetical protein COV07_00975 [Candidatus Vogelbacteria bacterium CG10_big_fil_rev_8_21_14_0_10_45_14]|uniref:Phosphatidic acid phosphatase type 2/haloperoxidase domain-containing protein n=1 Tax=Candidatus Vogelbacteria bacterium CG10_big_fil_rev_8_21_14_0_10_45_14 TaxID=1975042 RepID=A0A2H0RKH3_9BACT|nr:MAG: hypothetical protein COV07_00975 [Candidatus Vogelbacteria bacterium CG10_big_fil_rev_8_21_14_0_10_45_14]
MIIINKIIEWDGVAVEWIATLHTDALEVFFRAITYLGEWYIAAGIVFVITLLFLHFKEHKLILPFWFATGGSVMATHIIKEIVLRPRPLLALLEESSRSFPSGHATIAVALFGFVAWYLYRSESRRAYKVDVWFMITLILLIAFSRFYLRVHYPSDIVVGLAIGGLFLWIAIKIAGIILGECEKSRSFRLSK